MKYRFRPLEQERKRIERLPRRQYRLRGTRTLRRGHALPPEPIEWIPLYEDGEVFGRRRRERRRRKKAVKGFAFGAALVRLSAKGRKAMRRLGAKLRALRRPPKPRSIHTLPVFAGALCAALLVGALSAGGVLFGLFYGYGRAYDTVTIPYFLGKTPDAAVSEGESRIQKIIQYEYNPDVPTGLVIAQSPRGGVVRRIYEKDGACIVTLTVSKGEPQSELSELCGMTERDATLALKNQGLRVAIREQYSSTAPKGTVIETTPRRGATLSKGETVTLLISLGKQILLVSVPDLSGRTEQAAGSLLSAAGLTQGSVSYEPSSRPIGTVIGQSVAAGTAVNEGSAVSFTVSAGDRYAAHTVPDLYGMTEEQAKAALRQYGLVIGSIYTAGAGAGNGTVIAQSPIAGAPITSSTVSVDLYLSS